MGSFVGHAVPGSFFIIIGFWWTVAVLYRYLKLGLLRRHQFVSSPTFSSVSCGCGQLDIESCIIVGAVSIGLFMELVVACLIVGRPVAYSNMQHATMYLTFGLVAVANMLRHRMKLYFQDVDKVIYVLLAAAFLCEGLLFQFNMLGKSLIDETVHTLLLYCIWSGALASLGEMVYRDSIFLALGRGLFTVLQGTWFWQAGFIFYSPSPGAVPWEEENPHLMMLFACYFAWHVAAILIFTLIIAVVMALVLGSSRARKTEYFSFSSRQQQYSSLANEIDDPFED